MEIKADEITAILKQQLAENQAVWAAQDPSPGKGYVGFTPYNGP